MGISYSRRDWFKWRFACYLVEGAEVVQFNCLRFNACSKYLPFRVKRAHSPPQWISYALKHMHYALTHELNSCSITKHSNRTRGMHKIYNDTRLIFFIFYIFRISNSSTWNSYITNNRNRIYIYFKPKCIDVTGNKYYNICFLLYKCWILFEDEMWSVARPLTWQFWARKSQILMVLSNEPEINVSSTGDIERATTLTASTENKNNVNN